jgi:hypothetical protein
MMPQTEVLRRELQQLFDMSTAEQHIIHVKDEEDVTPIGCVLTIEAMVLIHSKKVDPSYEIVELPIPLPQSLFQSVQAPP